MYPYGLVDLAAHEFVATLAEVTPVTSEILRRCLWEL